MAALIFAVQWWRHHAPEEHYDILFGIASAAVVVLEVVRSLSDSKEKKEAAEKAKQAQKEITDKPDAALEALVAAQNKAKAEPPKAEPAPMPIEKLLTERLRTIIQLQREFEQVLREYATEKKVIRQELQKPS